tara:strand:- start:47 stop:697 length:651 start_codon:yes stop_codon:yes gene_type:complete
MNHYSYLDGTHKLSVIVLHGMYSNYQEMNYLKKLKDIKFIFIDSKQMTIDWPQGRELNVKSWYNYYTNFSGLYKYDKIDLNDLKDVSQYVEDLINQEFQLLRNYSKIILLGSSQGGTVAIHVALNTPFELGGVILLRSLLLNYTKVSSKNEMTVYLFCAGEDNVYIPKLYKKSFRRLINKIKIVKYLDKYLDHTTKSNNQEKFVLTVLKSLRNKVN